MTEDGDFLWHVDDRSKLGLDANREYNTLIQRTLNRFLFENNTPELQRQIKKAIDEALQHVRERKLREFLTDGNRAKITVMFRGREIVHKHIGVDICERVAAAVEDIAEVDTPPRMEGRSMFMLLTPGKAAKPKPKVPEAEAA